MLANYNNNNNRKPAEKTHFFNDPLLSVLMQAQLEVKNYDVGDYEI